ncbi:MAG: MotA/TolQ/ExbB proton channel family protein [Rickettsia sp.]|nr:MotA/TolQ/ExbB proton channel family protein [Rickettsia sp.]
MSISNPSITQNNFSLFTIWNTTDFVTKFIITILLLASIWSWFLFIVKFLKLYKINQQMSSFKAKFNHEKHLKTIHKSIKKSDIDPLSTIFLYSIREFESEQQEISKQEKLENIKKSSQISYREILDDLQNYVPILGTIASISPFVGLLGTIIGIINSFQSIASSKSANISVVAPGIAEALFVTALGLFVAIPALIFYNYLINLLEKIENKSENFIEELNLIISKILSK